MKFRKKPVLVDAVQYTPGLEDGYACYAIDGGRFVGYHDRRTLIPLGFRKAPAIKTLDWWAEVSADDWIITGILGERYPCKAEEFAQTYEAATRGSDGPPHEEEADICGVHFNTLGNWRKEKAFDAELKRAIVRNNSAKLPEVVASMADWAIREGNAAAAKLVLQINGMLTDKLEVETKDGASTDVAALTARIKALQVRKDNEDSADSQG